MAKDGVKRLMSDCTKRVDKKLITESRSYNQFQKAEIDESYNDIKNIAAPSWCITALRKK